MSAPGPPVRIALNGRFLAAVPTGVQRFAFEIGRRVLAAGDAVLLVPRGVRPPPELADLAPVRVGRLRGHGWEQLELPGEARRAGCAVTLNLANALPLRGGPHALVLHDAAVLRHPEWFGWRYRLWHRRVLAPAARRAAAVGTVSAAAATELAPLLGRPRDAVAVVAQGAAPLDAPAAPAAVAAVRSRYGLAAPYLLALGAGDPRKNVAFLEGVLAGWGEQGSAPPVLVVVGAAPGRIFGGAAPGGSPLPCGSVPGASRVGGAPAVLHTGRVDDDTLRALYTGAAAFCYPSLAEGFGRPPLEALACGAPVVAAPYGPAREALRDAALLLPLEAGAWTAALRRLLDEGPPRGQDARARAVVAAHRWEDGAAAALALCRAAAAGGAGGGGGRGVRRGPRPEAVAAATGRGAPPAPAGPRRAVAAPDAGRGP